MIFHKAISKILTDLNVTDIFGVLGDSNLFVIDQWIREGGRYIPSVHEANAVLMALGFSQVTGRPGVATVTCGPGLSNTVSALIEGVKAHASVLIITSNPTQRSKYYVQAINHRDLVLATGAGFEESVNDDAIGHDIAYALYRAEVERRPIVYNLSPYNLQWREIGEPQIRSIKVVKGRAEVDASQIEDAAGVIASSKRPLIIAGFGVTLDRERTEAVVRLAKRLEAPVMTSLRAKDLFRGNTENMGIFGISSRPEATEVIKKCDVILAIGASLNPFTTMYGELLKGKRVIFVNEDAHEFGRHVQATSNILGNPISVVAEIIDQLDAAEIAGSGFVVEEDIRDVADKISRPPVLPNGKEGVDVREWLRAIEKCVENQNYSLITGAGRAPNHAWHEFHVQHPKNFFPSINYGAIGMTLGPAIGAAIGTNSTSIVVSGDGGFILGDLVELNTAAREKLDIIIIIINDGGYGAEHIQFRDHSMDPAISLCDWPHFDEIAKAFGGAGIRVTNRADMERLREFVNGRSRKGPILINIIVDPDDVPRTF